MQRKIIETADGSKTIFLPKWNEHYHSQHGAIQEAYHVFIQNGLYFETKKNNDSVDILEIGFGTGLNAFITFLEAEKQKLKIDYTAVEAYPISVEEQHMLNYPELLETVEEKDIFSEMHLLKWNNKHKVSSFFHLEKQKKKFQEIEDQEKYHLIFFDAFGARVQPHLWTEQIFKKMHDALKPGGTLVTYSAKGSARRAMNAVGFRTEKLPGPPGKREMLRAAKNS